MKNLDEIAKGYNDIFSGWGIIEKIREDSFNKFCKSVKTYNSVLEIGLGNGFFTKMLAEKFDNVIAVDGSQITIDNVGKELLEFNNIEYICSYIENLKLDKKMNNIVMSHILEHLEEPVDALKNVKKLMNKDTVLYISVPNAMSINRQVAVKMGYLSDVTELNESDIKLDHKIVYKPENFKQTIQNAGLEIIEFGGSMFKPLTNKQIENDWTSEMIEGFMKLGDDYPELCAEIYLIVKIKQ